MEGLKYSPEEFKRRNLYIQNDLYKEVGILAAETDTDKSAILNMALLRYLAEQGRIERVKK